MKLSILKKYEQAQGMATLQYWHLDREMRNLAHLSMSKGGYKTYEISNTVASEEERNEEILSKAVVQLKDYEKRNRLKFKYFKKWTMSIRISKSYSYHLHRLSQYIDSKNSSLFRAFQKWKTYFKENAQIFEQKSQLFLQDRQIETKCILADTVKLSLKQNGTLICLKQENKHITPAINLSISTKIQKYPTTSKKQTNT
jgi:hypothetical protein